MCPRGPSQGQGRPPGLHFCYQTLLKLRLNRQQNII